jgi:hypothetical protein
MEYIENVKILKNNLNISNQVKSFDSNEEKEIDVLPIHLLDIQESSKMIVKLVEDLKSTSILGEDMVNDTLLDIGEELKHILYHIHQSRFFKYVTYLNE